MVITFLVCDRIHCTKGYTTYFYLNELNYNVFDSLNIRFRYKFDIYVIYANYFINFINSKNKSFLEIFNISLH